MSRTADTPEMPGPVTPEPISAGERRRVAAATIVGTTIEWYDFFIYGTSAALVFAPLFFAPLGGTAQVLVSYASVGLSFLFRPLGAFIAGHVGDRIGRRAVLVITLIGMGGATTLIGLLPPATAIGPTAFVLLMLLRIIQGLSAGGEWGGAALMAVEHAPIDHRARWGALPQIGVPLGLLFASGIFALMTQIAPGPAFLAWGWRVPFLLSVVLIGVGYWVRRRVAESPVFTEIVAVRARRSAPLGVMLRHHLGLVIVAALIFAGNNAVGYMTTGGFIQGYATNPTGAVRLPVGPLLWIVAGSSVVWLLFTWLSGVLADVIGRKNAYLIGWAVQIVGVLALFPLVNMATLGSVALALCLLAAGLGLTYGPLSALYVELFPASIRFSGVAVTYALGAVLGGAFAPFIAQALLTATHGTNAITIYLGGMTVIGFLATVVVRDRQGIDLGPQAEGESASSGSAFIFGREPLRQAAA